MSAIADLIGRMIAAIARNGRSHVRQNRFTAAEGFISGTIGHLLRRFVHPRGEMELREAAAPRPVLRCQRGEERAHLVFHLGGFREGRNELGFHMVPEPLAHSAQRFAKARRILAEPLRERTKFSMARFAADEWLQRGKLVALASILPL